MDVESEIVMLRMKVIDLEEENKLIKSALSVLDDNDTHTKNILTVLWADFKRHNNEEVVKSYG